MTDEELIARLRDAVNGEHDMTPHGADVLQAADRIEELLAERKKAVDAFVDLAIATLSQIKGESHEALP